MKKLSSLIANVVLESVDGASAARTETAAKQLELQERLDEPAGSLVSETEVDTWLRERFPPLRRPPVGLVADALDERELAAFREEWTPGETAVREGNVYVHPGRSAFEHVAEFPRIEGVLGIRLEDDDLRTRNGVAFLTARTVERVRARVTDRIGSERKTVLRQVVDRGMLSPVVTSMETEVKVKFGDELQAAVTNSREVDDGVPREAIGRVKTELTFDQIHRWA